MSSISLDPGIYANIFRVILPDTLVAVMVAPSNAFLSLRELRAELEQSGWTARVYRCYDQVFGYGQDMKRLASKGFQLRKIRILDYPQWCARLITEGLSDHLKEKGYQERPGKARTTLFEPTPYRTTTNGRLQAFRGYDLRAIYVRQNTLVFGLIVDVCWEIRDANGQRCNSVEIARYGATVEVAQIQEEFLPDGRINPEVSRIRFHTQILPFVREHKEFPLPLEGNIKAMLEETPIRVILGVPS